MGRARNDKTVSKETVRIAVSCTAEEKAIIDGYAESENKPTAAYIRDAVFEYERRKRHPEPHELQQANQSFISNGLSEVIPDVTHLDIDFLLLDPSPLFIFPADLLAFLKTRKNRALIVKRFNTNAFTRIFLPLNRENALNWHVTPDEDFALESLYISFDPNHWREWLSNISRIDNFRVLGVKGINYRHATFLAINLQAGVICPPMLLNELGPGYKVQRSDNPNSVHARYLKQSLLLSQDPTLHDLIQPWFDRNWKRLSKLPAPSPR